MKYILENVFILYPSFFTFLAIYYSIRIENFSTHESWQHFKNVFQQNHKFVHLSLNILFYFLIKYKILSYINTLVYDEWIQYLFLMAILIK